MSTVDWVAMGGSGKWASCAGIMPTELGPKWTCRPNCVAVAEEEIVVPLSFPRELLLLSEDEAISICRTGGCLV